MGVALNDPLFWGFSITNHPAIGVPPICGTPHIQSLSKKVTSYMVPVVPKDMDNGHATGTDTYHII